MLKKVMMLVKNTMTTMEDKIIIARRVKKSIYTT